MCTRYRLKIPQIQSASSRVCATAGKLIGETRSSHSAKKPLCALLRRPQLPIAYPHRTLLELQAWGCSEQVKNSFRIASMGMFRASEADSLSPQNSFRIASMGMFRASEGGSKVNYVWGHGWSSAQTEGSSFSMGKGKKGHSVQLWDKNKDGTSIEEEEDNSDSEELEEYKMGQLLAKGLSARVRVALHRKTGIRYAVKVFNKKLLTRRLIVDGKGEVAGTHWARAQEELANLRRARGLPYVIEIKEVVQGQSPDKVCGVMELAVKGSLEALRAPLAEKYAQRYFKQLATGLRRLHEVGVVHRDVKPSNILLTARDEIRLADLGCSRFLPSGDDTLYDVAGTPAFMAPEVCTASEEGYSATLADVWASGVTLYWMTTGTLPFAGADNTRTVKELQERIVSSDPAFPDKLSAELTSLLQGMLQKDPNARLNLQQVLAHAWCKD
eukprot:g2295.t1